MKLRRNIWLWIAGGALLAPFLLPLLFIVGVFCIQVGYELAGYHAFVFNGEKIAQTAIQNSDPRECYKIRVVFAINTNTYLEEQYCIYTYAKLTRDPSACELLLPGEYGWSCLGEISGAVFEGKPCRYSSVRDDVFCNKNFSEGELTIEHPQMENCALYKRNDLREWCYFERTAQRKDMYECDFILHPIVRDYCEYNYAIKMRDPLLCNAVQDEKRRSFCAKYVSLSVQYRGTGPTVL